MIAGLILVATQAAGTPAARPAAPPTIAVVVPPMPATPPPQVYFERAVPPRLLSPQLVGEFDYPASALHLGQQGVVGVSLTIGTDGRVTSCFVEQSSNYPVLDSTTCRLLTRRARFTPAEDGRGNLVPSAVHKRVGWHIPAEPLYEVIEWTSRIVLRVGPNGEVRSCKEEASQPHPPFSSGCFAYRNFGPAFLASIRGPQARGDATIVFQTDFVIGRAPQAPPTGARVIMRRAGQFTIGVDGKVSNCAITETVGRADLAGELCRMFEGPYLGVPSATEVAVAKTIFIRR